MTRVRPLRIRPGAGFACRGDGICCTDIHAIGPLSRREQKVYAAFDPGLVVRASGDALFQVGADGRCPFLAEEGCALHSRLGPYAKPAACQRFPFGLVATPSGGRVTTSHRCSCRSLGHRPQLSVADAEQALRTPSGRLSAETRVAAPIALSATRQVDFETYESHEHDLIAHLLTRASPIDVLRPGAAAPPRDLREIARAFATATGGSRFSAALAWFGTAALAVAGEARGEWPERPWKADLDRAETRVPAPSGTGAQVAWRIVADWAADEIWRLGWTSHHPLDTALGELIQLLEVAERLIGALSSQGARADRAAAEAVMILDLAIPSDTWLEPHEK